jgi:hypothetical protein
MRHSAHLRVALAVEQPEPGTRDPSWPVSQNRRESRESWVLGEVELVTGRQVSTLGRCFYSQTSSMHAPIDSLDETTPKQLAFPSHSSDLACICVNPHLHQPAPVWFLSCERHTIGFLPRRVNPEPHNLSYTGLPAAIISLPLVGHTRDEAAACNFLI